jgi:hypothetical protein
VIIPSRHRGLAVVCASAAAIGGSLVALHYHRLGLTLSHYDARAHLVVARRIVDSITPGWQQIGAVWLPLPHLLNMFPVQVDALYRNGASAVAISVVAFAVATGATSWIVAELTQSTLAGVVAAAAFALNPNVLYLQATPMTEPLVVALMIVAVAMLIRSCDAPLKGRATVGGVFALACLTRYEAWPVTAAALALATLARWRSGERASTAIREISRIAILPATAVVAFLVFSRIVIGQWFVSSGFFVPENKALGDPWLAAKEIAWGLQLLSSRPLMVIAATGLTAMIAGAIVNGRIRRKADATNALIPLALAAAAALPWAAFVKGHPFRIRYMMVLLPLEAIGVGVAAGLLPRFRTAAAVALLAVVVYELRPLDVHAPMVVEAQWEQPNAAPRRAVTDCLRAGYTGETIMASMGSLGHYMQEASRDGFDVRDFLHEGNGDIWLAALDGPRPFVGWMLIEEKANGGDMLARRARENPRFLDGFSRVCEGGGLVLYERQNLKPTVKR